MISCKIPMVDVDLDQGLFVVLAHECHYTEDSLKMQIRIIPDAFPSILEKSLSLAVGTGDPSSHHLSPVNTYN